ncbi:helix-turn-helix transcriptional regulator [Neptunicoccus cionae]|uniref:helix-turn-helix transcriptional regulator n=1 Tax=Neptunicoccus cionae TaxID=2035344 RepID=UPI000C781AFC|nr:transcriptional regulator [Amylibacter cionae]
MQDLSGATSSELVNERMAADQLCQSVRTLQKWRVTGYGPPHYKIGRSVRYRIRDLTDWIDSRRRGHTSECSSS